MAETKKTKYDTNPLDPDYVEQVQDLWGEQEDDRATQEVRGATREVRPTSHVSPPSNESARNNVYSEAPTRRYDSPTLEGSYPSVFVPPAPQHPVPYQRGNPYLPPPTHQQLGNRSVAGIGLPEKWATMLPYAPFYVGVVISIVELFFVPRKEIKVRFHAAQGLALHLAILAGQMLFGVVEAITGSGIGGFFFKLAATIFLIISMIRVWKGEPHHIAPLTEPAQWLNERIEPRNKG
ncbi:MAG TPA: hypothetical protein VJM12_03770 [Pyrinomonadaceae bacterium]|nr:hypothetical protein [Pyrinomonadaceae bacterium]